MSNSSLEEFATKFELDRLTLKEYDHWLLSLRPEQPTIGSMVVSLRRSCESLAALQQDECAELARVFAEVEMALDTTFGPDRVNYLALMMVDPHVHMHVLPRYASEVELGAASHADHGWPGPPQLSALTLMPGDLAKIASRLRSALDQP
jgi:diadenosine tetraphosphate (Ap4A) HIT family hydrolase